MDLPALIMVNPVLDVFVVFCLWDWKEVLSELAEKEFSGTAHCSTEAVKEKSARSKEAEEEVMIPASGFSSLIVPRTKSAAMHRTTDARQTIMIQISRFTFFISKPVTFQRANVAIIPFKQNRAARKRP